MSAYKAYLLWTAGQKAALAGQDQPTADDSTDKQA